MSNFVEGAQSVTRPLLKIDNLSKSFTGVQALSDVSLQIQSGEIRALLGENGAGKSTLIKVLTGVYPRDGGDILLDGKAISAADSGHAQRLGISTVYQEVNLIPTMSVMENLTLQHQEKVFGLISWKKAEIRARELLAQVGLDIDPLRQLDTYSIAIQQLVAIARALSTQAKMLILDEPTASLDSDEIKQLFDLMRRLKAEGMGIIFVTHFLDQVYSITDSITVLRNGECIGTFNTAELTRSDLVSHMVGKSLEDLAPSAHDHSIQHERKALLALNNVGKQRYLQPLSLSIAAGEIVGVAGLLGSGRTELCELAYGSVKPDQGDVTLGKHSLTKSSLRRAIQVGMGYCPEDRKQDGIVAELSVRENMILALQASKGWWSPISMADQQRLVEDMIQRLAIKTPDMDKPIGELSGGNQQKVILARWLITNPALLILDEPTRGIDIGAHHDIIQIIKELCEQGMGLLVASSELEELVMFAHRVVVMKDHHKVSELLGEDISEQAILRTIAS
ncbi:sugar ABC transporter ATP-binding protein [Marinomonas primoryensis]|uniref:Galactofuranose ABC transporter ATP-binding protein n=1 Tax=Marinomonas primoryensis TaxID=178399 RepID=A0A859CTE8_9GAMM|nr:sugar ABC transporter ATP-binding protein [Marinomonas primoryensis]QKK79525.1 Galactofuranose ABC transporter ATP-binding protein [Marinomonas primoryensis]